MTYTAASLIAVAAAVVLDLTLRTRLVRTRTWWTAYGIVVFFQLLTNGWLTGRGIVRYAGDAILGTGQAVALGQWRVAYAPVEDLGFGFALVLMTCSTWVWAGRRAAVGHPSNDGGRRAPSR